jgi:serine O-acetyltransferase
MLTKLKSFLDLVNQDAKAYGQGHMTISFFTSALLGLNTFSAVLLYRVGSVLYDKGMPWTALAKVTSKYNYWWNSCVIRPQARIGPGLHIPHPIGVHIGPISAGRNFIVHQSASLVLKDLNFHYLDSRAFPCFGDNVVIGPNAIVLGSVVIGDDVMIGAGAVVHNDVPAGSRAVGNPARIIPPRTCSMRTDAERASKKFVAVRLEG